MRTGFCVMWETKKKKNKKLIKGDFAHESYRQVELKQQEMKEKGYKVSEITQCIF